MQTSLSARTRLALCTVAATVTLAANSLKASFLPTTDKTRLLDRLAQAAGQS